MLQQNVQNQLSLMEEAQEFLCGPLSSDKKENLSSAV